ncbi:MAG: tetratricopeptide repeat protein [Lentisphaeria bacterium]
MLASIPVILLGLALAGYTFYRAYKNPERFITKALELQREGDYKAAGDQYGRAIRYSRSNAGRAELARRMVKALQAKDAIPIDQLGRLWQRLVSYRAHVLRFAPQDEQAQKKLLSDHFLIARKLNAPWAWQQAAEIADMVLLRAPDNFLAEKIKTISMLSPREYHELSRKNYVDIRERLNRLRKEQPDDYDLAYYSAYSLLRQARALKQEYQETNRNELIDKALNIATKAAEKENDLISAARLLELQFSALQQKKDDSALAQEWLDNTHRLEQKLRGKTKIEPALIVTGLLKKVARMKQYGSFNGNGPMAELNVKELEQRIMRLAEYTVTQAPGNAEALFLLASSQRQNGKEKAALESLQKVIKYTATLPLDVQSVIASFTYIQSRFTLADILLEFEAKSKDTKKSKEYRSAALENLKELRKVVNENNAYLEVIEGQLAYLDGDYRKAVEKLRLATDRIGQDTPRTLLFAGLSYSRLGETGVAVEQLSKYLSIPGRPAWTRKKAMQSLMNSAIQLREFDQAAKIGKKLLQQNPADIESHLALSETLLLQLLTGGVEQNTEKFAEALELLKPLAREGNRRAVQQLARVHTVSGDIDKALELLAKYCRQNPEDGQMLSFLYQTSVAANREDLALQQIRKSLDATPENLAAQKLALALKNSDQKSQTIASLVNIAYDPNLITRRLKLTRFMRQTGEQEEAEQLLTELRKKHPQNQSILQRVFYLHLQNQNWDKAADAAEAFGKIAADSISPKVLNARVALAREEPGKVVNLLEPVLGDDVRHSDAWTVLGIAYRQLGDLYKAQVALEKALKYKPDNLFTIRQLIAVCHSRGFNYQALDYMRQALRFAPQDEEMVKTFLNYLEAYENPGQALDLRLRLASVRPDSFENRRAIARLFLRTGQPQKGIAVLKALIDERPNEFANLISLAGIYATVQQKEKAREVIQSYLKSEKNDITAKHWAEYAQMMMRYQFPEEEIKETLQKAIELEKAETRAGSRALANWDLMRGRTEQAIEEYEALYEDLQSPDLLFYIARAHIEMGNYEKAYQVINKYLGSEQLTGQIAYFKAQTELQLGNLENARKTVNKAIKMAPGNPLGYLIRARLNASQNDPELQERVEKDLNKALEIRPRFGPARQMLASWLFSNGRPREAVEQAKRLVVQNPDNSTYRELLARLYLAAGNTDALRAMLEEWKATGKDDKAIKYWTAQLAQSERDWETAAANLAAIYKGNRQYLTEYVRVLLKTGEYDKALKVINENTTDDDEDYRLTVLKAEAYAAEGNIEKAVPLFKTAWNSAPDQFSPKYAISQRASQALNNDIYRTLLQQLAPTDKLRLTELHLARLDLQTGNIEEAIQRFKQLEDSVDKDGAIHPRVLLLLGNAYIATGNHKKAQYYLTRAAEKIPDNTALLNNLAYEMAVLGKTPFKAVNIAERALNNTGSDEQLRAYVLDTLGFAQFKANLLTYAETSLLRSIDIHPMPDNYLHLAEVYLVQKKPLHARRLLNLAKALVADDKNTTDLKGVIDKGNNLNQRIAELLKKSQQLEAELEKKKE